MAPRDGSDLQVLICDKGAAPLTLYPVRGHFRDLPEPEGALDLAVNAPRGVSLVNPPSPISRVLLGGSIATTFLLQELEKLIACVRGGCHVHRLSCTS